MLYSRETANKKMNHSCNELFKKAEKISINELTDGSTLQRNVRCFQKLFDELLYSRGKKQAENLQPSFEKLRIENLTWKVYVGKTNKASLVSIFKIRLELFQISMNLPCGQNWIDQHILETHILADLVLNTKKHKNI